MPINTVFFFYEDCVVLKLVVVNTYIELSVTQMHNYNYNSWTSRKVSCIY